MGSLSTGMKVFLAVDALLVGALVVVLAITVAGGGSTVRSPAAAPRPSVASTSPAPSAGSTGGTQALTTFASPSGNIVCTITQGSATCTIASITFTPPAVTGCTGLTGHVFTVTPDAVTVPCADGKAPPVAGPEVPVLDYGRVTSVDGFTCESSTNGIACRNDASKKGFTLARATYSLQG